VFNTVHDAVKATGANASVVYVPPGFAADAICEAFDAGSTSSSASPRDPILDMVKAKRFHGREEDPAGGAELPASSPGECKIGIMPGYIHKPGTIGIVSKSGTLTYERPPGDGHRTGQSTCIGIGGDPINGRTSSTSFPLSRPIRRPRRSS